MAVGAANGARNHQMPFFKTLQISFAFGFFQFFMPIVGWFLGDQFRPFISAYDHWVAFILLFILGAKMLFESFKNVKEEKIDIYKVYNNFQLLL
jgi:putative Mn2+ efflux pump MntP